MPRDSVRVIGVSADGEFVSIIVSGVISGRGNGGDLSITTGQLIILDGAQVLTGTCGFIFPQL